MYLKVIIILIPPPSRGEREGRKKNFMHGGDKTRPAGQLPVASALMMMAVVRMIYRDTHGAGNSQKRSWVGAGSHIYNSLSLFEEGGGLVRTTDCFVTILCVIGFIDSRKFLDLGVNQV